MFYEFPNKNVGSEINLTFKSEGLNFFEYYVACNIY